jgi:hypothetical protein
MTTRPRVVVQPTEMQLFFAGKHQGTVYQLHNPGLSFILFPSYYLDRRVTGSGVGYQGEFPAALPAVHVTLLALYAACALAVYGLLCRYARDRVHAWSLTLLGALTLPLSAFPFQIYPEIAASLVIVLLVQELIAPPRSGSLRHLGYGLLAGFLPWLHVRFGPVTLVVGLWMLTRRNRDWRSRGFFVAGLAVVLGALSLYSYRQTGSLIPVAAYGGEAPLSLARTLKGVPAFAFERVWGLFPHSPVYLFALPGIGLSWRRHSAVPWILAILLVVIVPAAGHAFWAGYTTPGRYIVAVTPLLLLFIADALAAWSKRRAFVAAFAVLTLVSLETAVRYNLHHVKEVPPIVPNGFSGWRFNLLFPSLGTETWTATAVDVVMLASWVAIALALTVVPSWKMRRVRTSARLPDRSPSRPEPGPIFAGLLTLGLLATFVALVTGEAAATEYLLPPREARRKALTAFVDLPRCAVCYSSVMGAVEPTKALGNTLELVDLRSDPVSPRADERVRIRVRPRSSDGDYLVGTVRLDFGDGTLAVYRRMFGDVEELHTYAQPGEYHVRSWFTPWSGEEAGSELTIRVRSR